MSTSPKNKTAGTKSEFDKVILGHSFCNQLQTGKGFLIAV